MKALKFTLKGRTGFFKKPDVNTYFYFTYGNIHKVALLGIFGAIIGLGGYNAMKLKESIKKSSKKDKIKSDEFPEFYEKLKNIQVSIVPNNSHGFIQKKIQIFNNSVGYASKEQGGNLIVKEQWLENPSWDIYMLIEDENSEKIAEYILDNKAVYSPYLGKNDHPADILNPEIIECEEVKDVTSIEKIDCLFVKEDFDILFPDNDEEEEETDEDDNDEADLDLFKYEERLPIGLNRETSMYESNTFIFTNMNVKSKTSNVVYKVNNKNLTFY